MAAPSVAVAVMENPTFPGIARGIDILDAQYFYQEGWIQ